LKSPDKQLEVSFTRTKEVWRPNLLKRTERADGRYENAENDPHGPWTSGDFTISLTGGQRGAQFAKTGVSNNIYEIVTPSGRSLMPTKGRFWRAAKETTGSGLAHLVTMSLG